MTVWYLSNNQKWAMDRPAMMTPLHRVSEAIAAARGCHGEMAITWKRGAGRWAERMQISWSFDIPGRVARVAWIGRLFVLNLKWRGLSAVFLALLVGGVAMAQGGPLTLKRDGRVISLEPYAQNV